MLLFAIKKFAAFCCYKLHDILFKKLMLTLLEVCGGESLFVSKFSSGFRPTFCLHESIWQLVQTLVLFAHVEWQIMSK